jgi:hypothetical protein
MLDYTDISTPVFGGHKSGLMQFDTEMNTRYLSESGDVVWWGVDEETDYGALFRDEEDISTPAIGQLTQGGDTFQIVGIDNFGNAVWDGRGPMTGHRNEVFVNTFNLSADALAGTGYAGAGALAVGENGQVLWEAGNAQGTVDLWLSTPVPEPSVLLLGLPILMLLRRRRR